MDARSPLCRDFLVAPAARQGRHARAARADPCLQRSHRSPQHGYRRLPRDDHRCLVTGRACLAGHHAQRPAAPGFERAAGEQVWPLGVAARLLVEAGALLGGGSPQLSGTGPAAIAVLRDNAGMTPESVKALVCDCDGVIVDSEVVAERALVSALSQYAPPEQVAGVIRELFGQSTTEILGLIERRF